MPRPRRAPEPLLTDVDDLEEMEMGSFVTQPCTRVFEKIWKQFQKRAKMRLFESKIDNDTTMEYKPKEVMVAILWM